MSAVYGSFKTYIKNMRKMEKEHTHMHLHFGRKKEGNKNDTLIWAVKTHPNARVPRVAWSFFFPHTMFFFADSQFWWVFVYKLNVNAKCETKKMVETANLCVKKLRAALIVTQPTFFYRDQIICQKKVSWTVHIYLFAFLFLFSFAY